jgi:type I restriction enzyme S subunit
MAGEWGTVELGEVAAVRSGYAFKSSDWKDAGIPVVKIANVKGGRLEMSGCSFVSESTAAESGEFQLSTGDILIAMTGYIGDVARVRRSDLPCALNQRVGKFSVRDDKRLDVDFLYTFLSWAETRRTIEGLGYGSAQPNVSPSLIHNVEIPLPPLAEQQAIAAVIGALDDKIELNRRMNATLEAMARALFQSWFVDFDPVRAKLDGRQPIGLDPDTAALFPDSFQDSEVGNIPKGWEVVKLKDLTSKIGSGATPRGGSEVYVDEGPALIRSQNVYDYEFRWAGLARLTDKIAEELKNVEVMKNDVLLNITGDSILRTCVVDPEALPARVNQHVAIIRAINSIPANYLHFYLVQESMKTFLIGMSAGATRHAITKGHLEFIDVLKPTALVLKAFEQRTTPWFAKIDANRSQSRTLATLRDMLLPKLLSGELQPTQN